MLDSDLGRIYECKNGTKTINQAVNRHLDRFPSDFYFQLSQDEYEYLQFQLVMNPISWTREMRFNYEECKCYYKKNLETRLLNAIWC